MVTCVVLESKQGATRGLVVGVVPSAGPRAEAWRTRTRAELPYKGNYDDRIDAHAQAKCEVGIDV